MPIYKKLSVIFIFVVVSFSVASTVFIIYKKVSIFPYAVTRSYYYDFDKPVVSVMDLPISDKENITFPMQENKNKTAFLKVNVKSSFFGKYFIPSVNLTGSDLTLTQYFEQGVKGERYINVSNFLSKGISKIRLNKNRIDIDDKISQLFIFENEKIDNKKILFLAPHPDDVEIAAYGLYSDSKNPYIVTVTSGDAGPESYKEIYDNKAAHYLKKGVLRTWDSITVPMLGGVPVENMVNLGFFDGTLNKMFCNKSKIVSGVYTDISDINTYRKQNISKISTGLVGVSNWESLVSNFIYLLDKIKPDVIVAPYPSLDKHKDHKFSSIALFEAIKASNIDKGDLYLYSNHYTSDEFFPHGDSGGTISLPPNFNDGIYFDNLYSYPLDKEKQKDKMFALEAMHDLRSDIKWQTLFGSLTMAVDKLKLNIMNEDHNFYKRAVRNNELFFVVKIKNLYNAKILENIEGLIPQCRAID